MKNKKVLIIIIAIIVVVAAVCGFLYYQNIKKIEEEERNEKIRKEEIERREEEKQQREEAKELNEKFLKYQNKDIMGFDVIAIMQEATIVNADNLIANMKNGYHSKNNSDIEIYIELKSADGKEKKKYSMDDIMEDGLKQFSNIYAMSKFEMKDIEYNEKTGKIKSIVLSEK